MTQLFDSLFINNLSPKTLVLFHGTGGDKSSLLFIDDYLGHKYNLLSLQGNILENGMPRFFKRTGPGIFDQQSIDEEVTKLKVFLENWCEINSHNINDLIYFGYSNGANMILSTLFTYPDIVSISVLLHPILPFIPPAIDLKNKIIYISNGSSDPMVPVSEQLELKEVLEKRGASPIVKEYPGGHGISDSEIKDVINFLNH